MVLRVGGDLPSSGEVGYRSVEEVVGGQPELAALDGDAHDGIVEAVRDQHAA